MVVFVHPNAEKNPAESPEERYSHMGEVWPISTKDLLIELSLLWGSLRCSREVFWGGSCPSKRRIHLEEDHLNLD